MSGWKAKRFWSKATTEACDGGYTIRLDARPVKTPAKAAFVLPTLAMAQASADEWNAQEGAIKPETMPMTRYANSAIDKVAHQRAEVVDIVAAYGATDLLCYRATDPAALIDRQARGWDPHLSWAARDLRAALRVTHGVSPIDQPAESLAELRGRVAALSPFHLAAFHDLVAITGSLILGFGLSQGRLSPDQAFSLARIDEDWQAELWGKDEEMTAQEALKSQGLAQAHRFFGLCG